MTRAKRWVYPLTVVVAVGQCGWWLFLGYVGWMSSGLMAEPGDPQIAINQRFWSPVLAMADIDAFAVIAFLLRPVGWGGLVLGAAVVASIGLSLWASVHQSDYGWLAIGGVPAAATLVMLLLLRRWRPDAAQPST
jgi:hypothetical protein